MTISPTKHFLAAALCLLIVTGCGGHGKEGDPRVQSDGRMVRVSLDDIGEKRGSFFTYSASGDRNVDFIVYRERSGTFRAVLDACRKCYRWRRGYVINGDHVVCRKCGERYELDNLTGGRGSCIPIPLTSSREGSSIVIPAEELESGARYF